MRRGLHKNIYVYHKKSCVTWKRWSSHVITSYVLIIGKTGKNGWTNGHNKIKTRQPPKHICIKNRKKSCLRERFFLYFISRTFIYRAGLCIVLKESCPPYDIKFQRKSKMLHEMMTFCMNRTAPNVKCIWKHISFKFKEYTRESFMQCIFSVAFYKV